MLRTTRQRISIRRVFESHSRPLSPEEVLSLAQGEVEGLGIATVYRALQSLQNEGWIVAVDLPGEPPRYERSGKAHHHHFHCRDCGRVYEMEGCLNDWKQLAPRGFRVSGHELLLYGSCRDCAEHKPAADSTRRRATR